MVRDAEWFPAVQGDVRRTEGTCSRWLRRSLLITKKGRLEACPFLLTHYYFNFVCAALAYGNYASLYCLAVNCHCLYALANV